MRKKLLSLTTALCMALCCLFAVACGDKTPSDKTDYTQMRASNADLKYDAYDIRTYAYPYWAGDTVYNETVMFLADDEGAPLMYPATEILKVTSFDLKTVYEAGKDYTYDAETNRLRRTADSAIPATARGDWYLTKSRAEALKAQSPIYQYVTSFPLQNKFTLSGETEQSEYLYFRDGGPDIADRQVAVTYRHEAAPQSWDLPRVSTEVFAAFAAKLESKANVKIGYLGDSVTYGAIASGWRDNPFAPYMEIYPRMITSFLQAQYGYDEVRVVSSAADEVGETDTQSGIISYVNTAKGGEMANYGYAQAIGNDLLTGLDLAIVAFGLNDWALERDIVGYTFNIAAIVAELQAKNPNVAVLVVSPMLGNPESVTYYETGDMEGSLTSYLVDIEEEDRDEEVDYDRVAVAEVTKMFAQMYHRKGDRYRDITTNNVNHPNDFALRIYPMTVLSAMLGYDYFVPRAAA